MAKLGPIPDWYNGYKDASVPDGYNGFLRPPDMTGIMAM
jgi:hypothetical protein